MRPSLYGALGALICCGAFGQDLIQCVDPHVEAAFLPVANDLAPPLVRGERPPQLNDLETPEAFEWIGSVVTEPATYAVFRTALDARNAEQRFLAALRQAGFDTWQDQAPTGFVLAGESPGTDVCRNGAHSTVSVRDRGTARFLTVALWTENYSPLSNAPASCGPTRTLSEQAPFMPPTSYFDRIPRLDLPAGVVKSTRRGAGIGFISGSGETFNQHIEVEGVSSAETVVGHLAQQIEAQGWIAEATWAGAHSAGSAWTREIDGTQVAGTLSANNIGGEYYSLNFRIVPME